MGQIKSGDSYDTLFGTIRHELRHGYQHSAVEEPEEFKVSEATIQSWEDNFDDYKTSEKDGFEEYRKQPIEADAREFGALE